jgi:hypothetical protein
MTSSSCTPGGDPKVIAEIALNSFAGFAQMLEFHGGPERRSDRMGKGQARMVETYDTFRSFEAHFAAEGKK